MYRPLLAAVLLALLCFAATAAEMPTAEKPYEYPGELVKFPGPWMFQIPKAHIILVSDQELEALSDPDKVIDFSLTFNKVEKSLRQICEEAKASGANTLIFAFDHFFSQYRPGQNKPRQLTPDMDEYISRIAAISKFAESYGLGLELSLLSPLEIGPAYRKATGESGLWMHYRKGLRDTGSGAYSVELWQQTQWGNNKGIVNLEDAGVRVFAFREDKVGGTRYTYVDPARIVEISDTAKVESFDSLKTGVAKRVRVYGTGRTDIGNLDRVIVVQQYRTPEMDYFSNQAQPYLHALIDKYVAAGVKLNGLYSDEMHIQQDWAYFSHHDHGEFALRYVSPGLVKKFAEKYGPQYADFAKYLVYFVHGQEDFAPDLTAKADQMHVFARDPKGIRESALMRARYYHLLQDGVVDLFADAKKYAESKFGHRLLSRAHATWAESPTIDSWFTGRDRHAPHQYEYTSNFQWSCTVHQAASACYDYFKWGDFLTGNGNDHTEGGWLDRDYFALALACSTGIINDIPYSYCAHWGVPPEVSQRRSALESTFGTGGSLQFQLVEDMQHRKAEVLMLYPMDLVAVDERFGSWMTQYGYADYITQDKLVERGKVAGGAVEVAGRKFTTLVALYEPFPRRAVLDMMRQILESGGRIVWSGPPPVLTAEGDDALTAWQDMFGVDYKPDLMEGKLAPGEIVEFEGALEKIQPQTILTDFTVDHIYPVTPRKDTLVAARTAQDIVGTIRNVDHAKALFLGFRPRDDQAASLGYETRTWFDVLNLLGSYPNSANPGPPDNPQYLSRTSDYLVCSFPNDAIAIAPHCRNIVESWSGGFARNAEEDKKWTEQHPLPPDTFSLKDFRVNGRTVTYSGRHAVAFRVNEAKDLVAFAGHGSNSVIIDGRETKFADAPLAQIAWAPVIESRRVEKGAVLQAIVNGGGTIRIPIPGLPQNLQLMTQGPTQGSRGNPVAAHTENATLIFDATPDIQGKWLYALEK